MSAKKIEKNEDKKKKIVHAFSHIQASCSDILQCNVVAGAPAYGGHVVPGSPT